MNRLVIENILGYPIAAATQAECLRMVQTWLSNGEKRKLFVCANPHSLMVAETDPEFQQAVHAADLVVPDGVGILLASKILGGSIRERVTGSDIFLGLSEALNRHGGASYFFIGSTEGNLVRIRENLAADFPNIRFAGCYSPPYKPEFSEEDNRSMIEAVNTARPDILWIGMTAPKQEKWIWRNLERVDVKFIGAIGAVFDFYTGNVKRSHPVFQKIGLEWLPRLIQEPRRLWRRNFVSNPKFMIRVLLHRIKHGKTASRPIPWTLRSGR